MNYCEISIKVPAHTIDQTVKLIDQNSKPGKTLPKLASDGFERLLETQPYQALFNSTSYSEFDAALRVIENSINFSQRQSQGELERDHVVKYLLLTILGLSGVVLLLFPIDFLRAERSKDKNREAQKDNRNRNKYRDPLKKEESDKTWRKFR